MPVPDARGQQVSAEGGRRGRPNLYTFQPKRDLHRFGAVFAPRPALHHTGRANQINPGVDH
jgi:hypothetical protein